MSFARHQAVGAYRRWEPPSFDDGQEQVQGAQTESSPPSAQTAQQEAPPVFVAPSEPPPPPEPAVALPTAGEIDTMFENARREGFAAGFVEGAEAARQHVMRLGQLANTLDRSLTTLDAEVAEELVALAIEVARKMVRRTLIEKPESVNDVVREALQALPQAQVRIHINPDDAAIVREFLAEQSSPQPRLIVEDDKITRGGCRLLSDASDIDATIESRWKRVLTGIGRPNTEWDADQ